MKAGIIRTIGRRGTVLTFKVIEAFAGIGAQATALKRISQIKPDFKYEIAATIEWEIGAMYAYDILHHGKQNLSEYNHFTKEDLIHHLAKFTISSDGKSPIKDGSLKRMSLPQLQAIFHSIEKNKNLVDISSVKASQLPNADLLTYSFPCQDLSISSYWHGNFTGIDKDIGNRSGLLWEVERILKECKDNNQLMPRFLLMENVSAIHGPLHKKNFELWKNELENLGYTNRYYDLDASNFNIPQSRTRTFMISVYVDDLHSAQAKLISESLKNSNLNSIKKRNSIEGFLRLDYSNEKYRLEAIQSTPNDTPSRRRIHKDSLKLARGSEPTNNIARTITTKQDRYPNAGIIIHQDNFGENKSKYRNLTPREAFILMGFRESDYQYLIDNNIYITPSRKMLSNSKLLKLAGNSIVVNVLQEIFLFILELKEELIDPFFLNKKITINTPLLERAIK